MTPDHDDATDPVKKPRARFERRAKRPDPHQKTSTPRSWTNKSMHHPATRIGEIKHGKT